MSVMAATVAAVHAWYASHQSPAPLAGDEFGERDRRELGQEVAPLGGGRRRSGSAAEPQPDGTALEREVAVIPIRRGFASLVRDLGERIPDRIFERFLDAPLARVVVELEPCASLEALCPHHEHRPFGAKADEIGRASCRE